MKFLCLIGTLPLVCFAAIYCMSQKIERPVLSGQRIKTRKRGNSYQNIKLETFSF